jgi:L-malate glycosyltransferase
MRVLLFEKRLDVGGTQVNSIELAAALRDAHHHEVTLFATQGPMSAFAKEKGLRWLPAPDASAHPSLSRARVLHHVLRRERPDVIHVWDWPQYLDAVFVATVLHRVPMVVTSMSMTVDRVLPTRMPTTFGTPELVELARAKIGARSSLILPPVDVDFNAQGTVDGAAFRQRLGIASKEIVLVTVSRLVNWMKEESLRDTIEVTKLLGAQFPLRFVIVGDGTSRPCLEALAQRANSDLGRQAVLLTGAMIDPRPAYAAADIVIGMGGSALRGMAFAKPVVVVGERGYSRLFSPSSSEHFMHVGMYGVGDGASAVDVLTDNLRQLIEDRASWSSLGAFSRQFVVNNFSLTEVSARLSRMYEFAIEDKSRFTASVADAMRSSIIHLGGQLRRQFAAAKSPIRKS